MISINGYDITPEATEFAQAVLRFPELAPSIPGLPDCPARARFFEMFKALWRPGTPIEGIAELTTVYPARTCPLASEAADAVW